MNDPGLAVLLIVEDDDNLRYLMQSAAERTGRFSQIHAVPDGRQALELAEQMQARDPTQMPDFILTDLAMPQVDGIELIRELKRRPETRDIPIAVMTSSNRPNDREDATNAGCCAFFNKPVRIEEMTTLIGSLPVICGTGDKSQATPSV